MKLKQCFLAFLLATFSFSALADTQYFLKPEGFWALKKKDKQGRIYLHSKVRVFKSGNKLFAKLIEYYPNKNARCCTDKRYSDKENYPHLYTPLAEQPLRGIILFKNLSPEDGNNNPLKWRGAAKASNYVWFEYIENVLGMDASGYNDVGILNPENGQYNSVRVTFTPGKGIDGKPTLQMRISNYGLLPTWFNSDKWLWDWFITDDVWEKVR